MVQFGNGNRNRVNLQIFHFRYSMPTPTRVQLFAQLLQMQTPCRGGRHGGEDYINAGMHIFRRDRMTQVIKLHPGARGFACIPLSSKR